jgi:dienelactone hydrolase
MSRITMCAAAALFIGNQAVAQEKVSFSSTDGDLKGGTPTTITGYLYKPAGAGPFAAVAGLPGCGGLKFNPVVGRLYGQWGEILSSNGYFFLLVDSLEPRGRDSLCGNSTIEPLREVTRDAVGGLNYLRSRPDVRPDRIAIMGWSYGANAMMLTIANDPERDFRAAIAFYPGCRSLLDAHWRARQPMLLLMGESDNVARVAPCKELVAEAQPPIDAHFYPNGHHIFDHANLPISAGPLGTVGSNPEARADAINRVTQFLAKQLQ